METVKVDARGEACPIPVVKTKQAIAQLSQGGTVETLVDNEIAVQNLTKMARQKGYPVQSRQQGEGCYQVVMTVGETAAAPVETVVCRSMDFPAVDLVVAVGADHMGEGDDRLGRTLLKGFLYALTTQDILPSAILFFNGGAKLTCQGSESLEDLNKLQSMGVEILTCGTCLDFYQLKEQLAVGGVTNMYDIVERQSKATLVLKP